jgi:hypothetical protein
MRPNDALARRHKDARWEDERRRISDGDRWLASRDPNEFFSASVTSSPSFHLADISIMSSWRIDSSGGHSTRFGTWALATVFLKRQGR